MFQVLDQDEIEFPFTDSAVFRDLERGTRRMVNPAAARDRYLSQFEAFLDDYRGLFRTLEMPHCVVRTDREPWQALTLFLNERRRLM